MLMSNNINNRWSDSKEQAKFLENSDCKIDKAYAEHLKGPNKNLPFSIMLVCNCQKCRFRRGTL